MAIAVVACLCGSSESMARNFLKSVNYQNWLTIPIHRGKEKSLSIVNQLPSTPEKEILQSLLKNAGKWVVVIGYNDHECKWSDISHNWPKSKIEAEVLVHHFE